MVTRLARAALTSRKEDEKVLPPPRRLHYHRHTAETHRHAFFHLVDRINYVGEATELATREAIYRRLVEGGVDKADAAYEALNLINYSRRGNPQGGLAQTFATSGATRSIP